MMIGVIACAFLEASEEQRADRKAKAYTRALASAEAKKFLPSEMDGRTAAEAESQLTETQNPLPVYTFVLIQTSSRNLTSGQVL